MRKDLYPVVRSKKSHRERFIDGYLYESPEIEPGDRSDTVIFRFSDAAGCCNRSMRLWSYWFPLVATAAYGPPYFEVLGVPSLAEQLARGHADYIFGELDGELYAISRHAELVVGDEKVLTPADLPRRRGRSWPNGASRESRRTSSRVSSWPSRARASEAGPWPSASGAGATTSRRTGASASSSDAATRSSAWSTRSSTSWRRAADVRGRAARWPRCASRRSSSAYRIAPRSIRRSSKRSPTSSERDFGFLSTLLSLARGTDALLAVALRAFVRAAEEREARFSRIFPTVGDLLVHVLAEAGMPNAQWRKALGPALEDIAARGGRSASAARRLLREP